jgi:hypothetical protein
MLVPRGKAAGHMIEPDVVYRAKNPHALKNENKPYLSVSWQHNLRAWVTAVFFAEPSNKRFIPEVKEYLEKDVLPLKILLITYNAPGHHQSISMEDESVQVVFLPPTTTSLFQPLDQRIISCVKASYYRQAFEIIRTVIDADSKLQVMDCWKSFKITDTIIFIKTPMDGLRPETVNAC